MRRRPTVRLPEDARPAAPGCPTSLNALVDDSLTAEIDRVRGDDDFTARAQRLLERDRELLDRLAR